jgi:hypothetical protein
LPSLSVTFSKQCIMHIVTAVGAAVNST